MGAGAAEVEGRGVLAGGGGRKVGRAEWYETGRRLRERTFELVRMA